MYRSATNLHDTSESSSRLGQPKYRLANLSNRIYRNLTSISAADSCILIALVEGRGNDRGQIGMATMDLRYSELTLCQFVDTSSYTLLKMRLGICEPVEVSGNLSDVFVI